MELTPEQQFNLQSTASQLFAGRKASDVENPALAAQYDANPDAQRMYFRGVHDTLTFLHQLYSDKAAVEVVNALVEALHDETCEGASSDDCNIH